MKYLDENRDPRNAAKLAVAIARTATRPWVIMEVCGGQTHTIVKYGIDRVPACAVLHGRRGERPARAQVEVRAHDVGIAILGEQPAARDHPVDAIHGQIVAKRKGPPLATPRSRGLSWSLDT